MTPSELEAPHRPGFAQRLRNYLITGLLALAPTAVTFWVFFRLLDWVDNLLGRYLRFSFVEYHRIPGIGVVATLIILVLVGGAVTWIGRWIGGRSVLSMWDHLITRIPGVGILYGSTKSLGEAFLNNRKEAFKQVVLIAWPYPGVYRVGFLAGQAGPDVRAAMGGVDVDVVFVPHTPNPASGFVHYVRRADVIYLDWPLDEGLRVVVSGGLVQPGSPGARGPAAVPRADATATGAAGTETHRAD
jgi:uncharacterized membrane protein